MKKYISIILLSLLAFLPVIVDAKEDKAIVHVFYAEWCGNCTNLHNYLNELENDKDYKDMFEVVSYRLDNSSQYGENKDHAQNEQLFLKVSSYLKTDGDSIPFIVIGEEYDVGFSKNQTPATVKALIKKEYFNKNKKNIVQDIKDGKIEVEIDIPKKDDEKDSETKATLEKSNRRTTTIIGIGVVIVTLITVAVIIVISIRRK